MGDCDDRIIADTSFYGTRVCICVFPMDTNRLVRRIGTDELV